MLQRMPFATSAALITALLALGACEKGGAPETGGTAEAAPASAEKPDAPPQYVSFTDQFAALQVAGLRARYPEFAGHLKAQDPETVVAALRKAFQGRPFDVYTISASFGPDTHQRLVQLRSTTGRLYLLVEMKKVEGGWRVADYRLDKKRAALGAQL